MQDNHLVVAKLKHSSRKCTLLRDASRLCTWLSTVVGHLTAGIFLLRGKNLAKVWGNICNVDAKASKCPHLCKLSEMRV